MRLGLRSRGTVTLLALCLCGTVTAADRLHLAGGGTIVVARWWTEGDTLLYDTGAGTIGLPRSSVVRIERGGTPKPSPVPRASRTPSTPPDSATVEARPAPSAKSVRAAAPRQRLGNASHRRDVDPSTALAQQLEQAAAGLSAREFESANAAYLKILRSAPESPEALLGYALSEMALGRDRIALSVVLDVLSKDPDQPAFQEMLGDLRNREERVEDALAAWQRAYRGLPNERLKQKIEKAQRELSAGGDYDLRSSTHFNLRYDGAVDQALAQSLLKYLEEQFWILADELRHAPARPITVLLYPTKEFREVTQSPDWVGGIYDGKIRVPLAGLRTVTPRARGVLVHELTHAFIHSKTRGHCPRWLHEGLAQRFEGKRTKTSDVPEIRKVLREGNPAQWEERGFTYPAALSLVQFLESRRGLDGLVWLLDELAGGQSLDRALERTFGMPYSRLCLEWQAFLERAG